MVLPDESVRAELTPRRAECFGRASGRMHASRPPTALAVSAASGLFEAFDLGYHFDQSPQRSVDRFGSRENLGDILVEDDGEPFACALTSESVRFRRSIVETAVGACLVLIPLEPHRPIIDAGGMNGLWSPVSWLRDRDLGHELWPPRDVHLLTARLRRARRRGEPMTTLIRHPVLPLALVLLCSGTTGAIAQQAASSEAAPAGMRLQMLLTTPFVDNNDLLARTAPTVYTTTRIARGSGSSMSSLDRRRRRPGSRSATASPRWTASRSASCRSSACGAACGDGRVTKWSSPSSAEAR